VFGIWYLVIPPIFGVIHHLANATYKLGNPSLTLPLPKGEKPVPPPLKKGDKGGFPE
jgi:hypothetical protein